MIKLKPCNTVSTWTMLEIYTQYTFSTWILLHRNETFIMRTFKSALVVKFRFYPTFIANLLMKGEISTISFFDLYAVLWPIWLTLIQCELYCIESCHSGIDTTSSFLYTLYPLYRVKFSRCNQHYNQTKNYYYLFTNRLKNTTLTGIFNCPVLKMD